MKREVDCFIHSDLLYRMIWSNSFRILFDLDPVTGHNASSIFCPSNLDPILSKNLLNMLKEIWSMVAFRVVYNALGHEPMHSVRWTKCRIAMMVFLFHSFCCCWICKLFYTNENGWDCNKWAIGIRNSEIEKQTSRWKWDVEILELPNFPANSIIESFNRIFHIANEMLGK